MSRELFYNMMHHLTFLRTLSGLRIHEKPFSFQNMINVAKENEKFTALKEMQEIEKCRK